MANGPPWIQSIEESGMPDTHLNNPPTRCYHIHLDETKLWNVECSVALNGTNNELNIAFYKPNYWGPQFIGQFNKNHPNESGSWVGAKFDNQDIYVLGTYKDAPIADHTFNDCTLVSQQLDTNPNVSWGLITFGGAGSTAAVKLTCLGRGEKNLSFGNLLKVSGALGVTVSELLSKLEDGANAERRILEVQRLVKRLGSQRTEMERTLLALQALPSGLWDREAGTVEGGVN